MKSTIYRYGALIVLVFSLASLGAACGSSVEYDDTRPESEQNAEPQPLNQKVFIDATEFAELRDQGAVILDSRALEDYEAGHIAGAVHSNGGKEFQDDWGMVKDDPVALQTILREQGIKSDKPVIVYGGALSSRTGRLFWTLEYLGHGEVYFYPDGVETLAAELSESLSTEAVVPEEGDFVVARRESIRASGDEVLAVAEGRENGVLIDSRRLGEYEGTEDRGDPRQGYIPSATYYYWEDVFDTDGNLRDRDELRAEFEANGLLDDDVVVIPYCQTGVRSATVYAVLRWLGHASPKNYDGSWYEWSRLNGYPVAQVESPTAQE